MKERETKQTENTVLQRKLSGRLVCFQHFHVVGMNCARHDVHCTVCNLKCFILYIVGRAG